MIEVIFSILGWLYVISSSEISCDPGSIKYPIIWGTNFDDIWYSNSSAVITYNTSYVDDVILYQNETLYMATRFSLFFNISQSKCILIARPLDFTTSGMKIINKTILDLQKFINYMLNCRSTQLGATCVFINNH